MGKWGKLEFWNIFREILFFLLSVTQEILIKMKQKYSQVEEP